MESTSCWAARGLIASLVVVAVGGCSTPLCLWISAFVKLFPVKATIGDGLISAVSSTSFVWLGCENHQGEIRRKASAMDRLARSISSRMQTSIKRLQPKRRAARKISKAIRAAAIMRASSVPSSLRFGDWVDPELEDILDCCWIYPFRQQRGSP